MQRLLVALDVQMPVGHTVGTMTALGIPRKWLSGPPRPDIQGICRGSAQG